MQYLRSLTVIALCSIGGVVCVAQPSPTAGGAERAPVGAPAIPSGDAAHPPSALPPSDGPPQAGFGQVERRVVDQQITLGTTGMDNTMLSYVTVSGKTEPAAYAGLVTSPVSPALAEQLKLPKGIGLMVDFVEPKSPAEAADVKQYDILYKLDDQLLVNAHQFTVLVRTHKAGDEVTLTVIHRGDTGPRKVKLVERDLMALDARNPWGIPTVPSQGSYGYSSVTYQPIGAPTLKPVFATPDLPGDAALGVKPFAFGSGGETRWNDEQGAILVQPDFGGRRVIVTNKEGKWLSAYQLNDDDKQMKILPPDVRSRYEKLLKAEEKVPGPFAPPGAPSAVPAGAVRFGGERSEVQVPGTEPGALPKAERR